MIEIFFEDPGQLIGPPLKFDFEPATFPGTDLNKQEDGQSKCNGEGKRDRHLASNATRLPDNAQGQNNGSKNPNADRVAHPPGPPIEKIFARRNDAAEKQCADTE